MCYLYSSFSELLESHLFWSAHSSTNPQVVSISHIFSSFSSFPILLYLLTFCHNFPYESISQITPIDPVSEMTYIVSSGTLNSTIPYHTTHCIRLDLAIRYVFLSCCTFQITDKLFPRPFQCQCNAFPCISSLLLLSSCSQFMSHLACNIFSLFDSILYFFVPPPFLTNSLVVLLPSRTSDLLLSAKRFHSISFIFHILLASEGWWEAWQTSSKVTRSY